MFLTQSVATVLGSHFVSFRLHRNWDAIDSRAITSLVWATANKKEIDRQATGIVIKARTGVSGMNPDHMFIAFMVALAACAPCEAASKRWRTPTRLEPWQWQLSDEVHLTPVI